MKRRFAFSALGSLVMAGLGSRALAQHDHHGHGPGHGAASPGSGRYKALQSAAATCVADGEVCLAHCLRLLANGDKAMGDCAKGVNQMLALCGALQSLAAQGAALTPAAAKVALDACRQCADSCKPHVEHHAECKACHDSCLECIKQCQAVT